jgi:hypothetical protein
MALAGTLEIQMLANMARLQTDMNQAKTVVGSAMANIESTVASAKAALGALGIGLGVGYFVSLIKGSIDAADHLDKLHKSTNISVEDLAGLSLLARQTGTDIDGLAKGINKMSVEIGKDPEKFRALGVTAKDNKEAFKQLADIFNLLPDIQQRNALAQAVFAKSWAEMAPALSEGGKKIGEVIDKGAKLSGVTEEMVQQAHALNNKWAELHGTGGLLTRLTGPMLPLLNSLADSMLDVGKKTDGATSAFQPLAEILRVLLILGANVIFTFETIGKDIARAVENVKLIAKGDFAGSRALGEMFRKDAEAARKALDAYEKKIMGLGLTGTAAPGAPLPDPAAAAAAAARAAAFLNKDKAVKDRTAEYERAARAMVEGEEQAARDITEAWKAWEDIQLKNHNDMTAAWTLNWKQVFDTIDQEQADAIEQGRQYLEALNKDAKKNDEIFRQLGLTFSSAFGQLITAGGTAGDVMRAFGKDIAQLIAKITILEPLAENLRKIFKDMGGAGGSSILDWFRGGGSNSGVGHVDTISAELAAGNIMGPYATGTNYVPRTGLAWVDRGEIITPAAENRAGGSGGVQNIFYVDMSGAYPESMRDLRKLVVSVNGSVESRALNVMKQARVRGA